MHITSHHFNINRHLASIAWKWFLSTYSVVSWIKTKALKNHHIDHRNGSKVYSNDLLDAEINFRYFNTMIYIGDCLCFALWNQTKICILHLSMWPDPHYNILLENNSTVKSTFDYILWACSKNEIKLKNSMRINRRGCTMHIQLYRRIQFAHWFRRSSRR